MPAILRSEQFKTKTIYFIHMFNNLQQKQYTIHMFNNLQQKQYTFPKKTKTIYFIHAFKVNQQFSFKNLSITQLNEKTRL